MTLFSRIDILYYFRTWYGVVSSQIVINKTSYCIMNSMWQSLNIILTLIKVLRPKVARIGQYCALLKPPFKYTTKVCKISQLFHFFFHIIYWFEQLFYSTVNTRLRCKYLIMLLKQLLCYYHPVAKNILYLITSVQKSGTVLINITVKRTTMKHI